MAEIIPTKPHAPMTTEAFVADRQHFFTSFTRFMLYAVVAIVVLLVLMDIFLV